MPSRRAEPEPSVPARGSAVLGLKVSAVSSARRAVREVILMAARTGSKRATHVSPSLRASIRQRPLVVYALLSTAAFIAILLIHSLLTAGLSLLNAEGFSRLLTIPFAVLFACLFSALALTVLLHVWLNLRLVGVGLSLAAAVLWLLGLRRHLGSPSVVLYLLPLVAAAVPLWWGLRRASHAMLPLPDDEQRAQMFSFVKAYLFGLNRPAYVVDPTKRDSAVVQRVPGDELSRASHASGLVLTGCDHAVALSDGLRFKGVHRPGIVFTRPGDRVVQAVDLRPQVRSFPVTALTRDGIEVRVDASVAFKIHAGRRQPRLGQPLPFNVSAALKALHAQRVEHVPESRIGQTLEPRVWHDLPRVQGEHILRNSLSNCDFDDLYGPHQPAGEAPRRTIAEAFRRDLDKALQPSGIQLIAASIGNLEPANPDVYLRRARNWQAVWTRKITLKQAEGQAERLQVLERARADSRADVILDLGRQLEELTESRADLDAQTLLDQFLVVLDELTAQPQLRHALPQHTKDLLSAARQAVDG